MKNKYISFYFLLVLSILIISKVSPTKIGINETMLGYLNPNSYVYYELSIENDTTNSDYLLIEARRNKDQDILDNIFSDPNLYVSTFYSEPGPNKNEWSSDRFGDEIISINKLNTYRNKKFYISVYCQFSCNFLLRANLFKNYELKENVIYTVSMIPSDIIKLTFTSKKDYNRMKVNCISFKMRPFRIFMAKNDPSSTNTIKSRPIFINGYNFLVEKGDENYGKEQEYNILIENKEYKQDLLFWVSYDQDETKLNELSPTYNIAEADEGNCYVFTLERQYLHKNVIISTILFNGKGFIKIGGWNKVNDFKIKSGDDNIYEIITDKSILLTDDNFKKYGKIEEDKDNDLHFCFIAEEETSYVIKIYYQQHTEEAQRLNFLLPGIRMDDMLPSNNMTKYNLLYLQQNKDIKININVKKGNVELYAFFSYEENPYVNKEMIKILENDKNLIRSKQISYQTYEIKIDKSDNICLLTPKLNDNNCALYAIIYCNSNIDCLYDVFFDHIGDVIYMKPKVPYSNVITQKEVDLYEVHITDENIKNFAVILTQNTGITKLKLTKFFSTKGNINFGNTEKFNKEYIPNIIEVKLDDFPSETLVGTFQFEVEGSAFSSYEIYYYTFDNNAEQLDHKTITMSLVKGKTVQDYIKINHHLKIFSYDNSENNKEDKKDLYIYLNYQSIYSSYDLYVFKSLDDYYYENKDVQGYLWKSGYENYIHISKKDPNYITGNLYIMVFLKHFSEYLSDDDKIINDKNIETPFTLVLTDESTPITLIEGSEFRHTLTTEKPKQKFYFNHYDKENNFIMTINVPNGKVKFGLKVGTRDVIYQKIVTDYYYVSIKTNDMNTYWPSDKSCIVEINIEADNYYDLDFDVVLLCKSSVNSIVELKNNNFIDKKIIMDKEKQYYYFIANPLENNDIKINTITSNGQLKLYAKKADFNQILDPSKFPSESSFEYSNLNNLDDEISTLSIPYSDIRLHLPCKILLTVEGALNRYYSMQSEYSLSISNIIDDIMPNKNYKLMISKGEIKYYHFLIKGNKKRLSVSMTNKQVDAFMYLNYGTMNNDISKFQWRSEGNFNEYIDISIDDSFFISRKKKNLDGDYYLAIRGFENTYFNLYISDLDIKLMTISEEFPGVCRCEKEGDFCYFRYENINNMNVLRLSKQEFVFYFDFTYGNAQIYANLYENGNNGYIIKNLPSIYHSDYTSNYGDQYLKIELKPRDNKYTLDSVLILGAKCNTKALFDFNVRPIWKSGDILRYNSGIAFLDLNQDNVCYLSEMSKTPIKLAFYNYENLPLHFGVKALSGSAEVHCYSENQEQLYDVPNAKKEYKHISKFSVDEKDSSSFFETIYPEGNVNKSVVFEVKVNKNCLFSVYLHYDQNIMQIPISKQIQGKLKEGKFYGYIELLPEYDEIVLSVDKMRLDNEFSIFVKTSIVDSINKINYNMPSSNNYDIKAITNPLGTTLDIKIKNVDKELFNKGKKILTAFYIEGNNMNTFEESLNIIVYPNVDHYELIHPKPNKYVFNSISQSKKDTTYFSLKRMNHDDDILVVEISSCQGNFGYKLFNNLKEPKSFGDNETTVTENQGKKTIVKKMENNEQYYLSVYGLKEDEIVFEENKNNSNIDFLMYYYTTNEETYTKTVYDTKIEYEVESPGYVILKLPDLMTISTKNNKIKLDDLIVTLIMTENEKEFNNLGSICYLTKKIEEIIAKGLYLNYTIVIDKKQNKIEIKNLNKKNNYYLNVLISNTKTGQFFAMEPIEIIPNNFLSSTTIVKILIIGIIISLLLIFYFYRKYRITKQIVNYENSDIKKMSSIPKSINELKKIQEEKTKKAKEKYNSLTEDSSDI